MKALALFSGGLDSLLAIKIIQEQGIEVIALYMQTGFGGRSDPREKLEKSLSQINAKLQIIDIRQEYINTTLFNPRYGYGKNFNPCIDCHSHMIAKALSLLKKYGASFLISGEVVGQRPMSQNSSALQNVEKLSDANGLLLRPLCAKILPPTIVEQNGWIQRENMYDINGRSRVMQIQLIEKFGIKEYEKPGGGCLLTDIGFSLKMKDFVKYDKDFLVEDMEIMKYGRHFRLPNKGKLIISRDEMETCIFENIKHNKFEKIYVKNKMGPLSLMSLDISEDDHKLGLEIILAYYKTILNNKYELLSNKPNSTSYFASARFENKQDVHKYLVS